MRTEKDYDKLIECRKVLCPRGALTKHDSDRVLEQIYDWVRTEHINKAEFHHLIENVVRGIGFCS